MWMGWTGPRYGASQMNIKTKCLDTKYCCNMMKINSEFKCSKHKDQNLCPDKIINRFENGTTGIIIHDGGNSMIKINYCPWCGKKISENKLKFKKLTSKDVKRALKLPTPKSNKLINDLKKMRQV